MAETAPDRSPDAGIDVRAILLFGGVLTLLMVVTAAACWLILVVLEGQRLSGERRPTALEASAPRLPPEPRLQASPPRDMEAFRREQETRLETYGWVDRGAGVARIPVERAAEILAEGSGRTSAEQGASAGSDAAGGAP